MTQKPARSDADELVKVLRERLNERRRAGLYPEGLESSLDAHAQRILGDRSPIREDQRRRARQAMERLEAGSSKPLSRSANSSRVPLGNQVHATFGRLQSRHLDPVVDHVNELFREAHLALTALLDVLDDPEAHQHGDVLEQLDALFDRLGSVERASKPGSDLEARVLALEKAEQQRSFNPFYSSKDFEDRFRGKQEHLASFYTPLADQLVAQSPVLEIGCGQGSLLTLLAAREVQASGVELDPDLAAGCRATGLDVVAYDGIELLSRMPASSLGAVVMLHVIEHLTPQRLSELVVIACEKLQPGGWLVMETPNPQSLYVFARAFYLDPTHQVPVHPSYLEFLVRQGGFSGVRVEWLSPVAEDEALVDDGAENSRRIGELLFGPQDYRLYAVR